MNIYIPNISFEHLNAKSLFVLTRPFLLESKWGNDSVIKTRWNVSDEFAYVSEIESADIYLIPKSIQNYSSQELDGINIECQKLNIKAYGYIGGDFGLDFGDYSNIVFFRMGGFKSQLGNNNKGFPFSLSDHFQRIFHHDHPVPSEKNPKPIIGFCGHATTSRSKQFKEIFKCLKENVGRFLKKPFRKDFEPIFASAYERAKLLQYFEKSSQVKTNFIYRNHYRGGALTEQQRTQTTLEYYNNISDSDYVLCVRGAGNFSVRLYETLMMGKIPVFVNTDCLLPFEDKINWHNHVVWVEWKDRKKIATIAADFHQKISSEDFIQMQIDNRLLWKEDLSVNGILNKILDER